MTSLKDKLLRSWTTSSKAVDIGILTIQLSRVSCPNIYIYTYIYFKKDHQHKNSGLPFLPVILRILVVFSSSFTRNIHHPRLLSSQNITGWIFSSSFIYLIFIHRHPNIHCIKSKVALHSAETHHRVSVNFPVYESAKWRVGVDDWLVGVDGPVEGTVVEIPLFTHGYNHWILDRFCTSKRWLGMGFLNHQQEYLDFQPEKYRLKSFCQTHPWEKKYSLESVFFLVP